MSFEVCKITYDGLKHSTQRTWYYLYTSYIIYMRGLLDENLC